MYLNKHQVEKILFLDVETVPAFSSLEDLNDEGKELWAKKAFQLSRQSEDIDVSEWYSSKAGIFAEFGKIICISVGYVLLGSGNKVNVRLKSFAGDDEHEILTSFAQLLETYFNDPAKYYLCGHNIKEFDIPYLSRRMLVHKVRLPVLLNISGKKPWQVEYLLDTMEMWKFGDYKNYTSLRLLSHLFGIPSPKDDIDGSQVAEVYYMEKDMDRIVKYCERDVLTVIKLLLTWNQFSIDDLIRDES